MSMSNNIYKSHVCDPFGLYISLVNNLIKTITLSWSNFINYLYQHID